MQLSGSKKKKSKYARKMPHERSWNYCTLDVGHTNDGKGLEHTVFRDYI